MSLFFVITCFWFLFIPGFKKLKLFTYIVATPWIFLFLRIFLFTNLKVIGKNKFSYKDKMLFICNHQSWIDVPVFYGYTKACGVSKKEVKYLPLIGLLIIYSGGAIFLDRKKQASRMHIIKEIITLFKQNVSIFLFPEGTRSGDGRLLRANKAIIKLCYKLKIPVVAAALEGTRDILPRNRIYFKPFKKVVLEFNEPIKPDSYKNEDEFANACWDKVKETHKRILKEHFPNKFKKIYLATEN
jgi:1-acyl-sn-glycerol-3-phosphate acyltransferase